MGQVKFRDSSNQEHVLNVDVHTYIDLAGRTNNPDYEAVGKRMVEGNCNKGIPMLISSIAECLDHDLDQVKKHLFYGKELKTDALEQLTSAFSPGSDAPDMTRFQNNPEMIDIFHGAVGLATEAGEILKALVKFMQTGEIDIVNVGEENGDAFWYQALLLKRSKMNFEQVMTTNIQKLAERFKDGFTEDAAINRNVVAERVILDQGLEVSGHHFQD